MKREFEVLPERDIILLLYFIFGFSIALGTLISKCKEIEQLCKHLYPIRVGFELNKIE
jgi:hypothetical protein